MCLCCPCSFGSYWLSDPGEAAGESLQCHFTDVTFCVLSLPAYVRVGVHECVCLSVCERSCVLVCVCVCVCVCVRAYISECVCVSLVLCVRA